MIPSLMLEDTIKNALKEDLGQGDLTTLYTVPAQARGSGRILAKETGIMAGLFVAGAVFHYLDGTLLVEQLVKTVRA